jgi:RimJ/RimL family protein N-acetyltransferase
METTMSYSTQLFEGNLICLAPIDQDQDPEVFARWSQDDEYLLLSQMDLPIPISKAKAKKKLEAIEKAVDENKNIFFFTIRTRGEDRLVGYAQIFWIEWSGGVGRIDINIGEAADRRQGYGSEALYLLLGFAFNELNLYNLAAWVPEYNPIALKLFLKHGFVEEARRRQVLERDGRRWDVIHLGLLREDFLKQSGVSASVSSHEKIANPVSGIDLPRIDPILTPASTSEKPSILCGRLVRLAVDEPEIMGKALANWVRNSEYARLLDSTPVHFFSAKKIQDWIEKDLEKDPPQQFFTIHTLEADHLIGFIGLDGISWHHRDAWVGIGIGDPAFWGKGYGTDAMQVLLRYAFTQINLERVSLSVFGYNPRAMRSYEKAGFKHEGAVRGFLYREGQRSDLLMMGVLRHEWINLQNGG